MSDGERKSRPLAETWAHALGVPKERLVAIVEQVVEERRTLDRCASDPPAKDQRMTSESSLSTAERAADTRQESVGVSSGTQCAPNEAQAVLDRPADPWA